MELLTVKFSPHPVALQLRICGTCNIQVIMQLPLLRVDL
jgi:hypothetical protein